MKATDGYTVKALESVTSNDKPGVQIVYKVFGDVNGFISGDNITVILMGDGNVNGDVKVDHGEVVLIKGDINGDVNAETLVCPEKPEVEMEEDPAKKTDLSAADLYVKIKNKDSCENCIYYHSINHEMYKVYCEHFHKFFIYTEPACVTGYKRRD